VGTCSVGQLTKGAQVSSPLVMAVEWTRRRCSVEDWGIGASVLKLRASVLVLKMMAFWVVGRDSVAMVWNGTCCNRDCIRWNMESNRLVSAEQCVAPERALLIY